MIRGIILVVTLGTWGLVLGVGCNRPPALDYGPVVEKGAAEEPPDITPEERQTLAEGNNALAAALYPLLKEEQGKANLFFSPTSLATALAMLHLGARGQTAEQIAQVLQVKLPADKLHPAAGRLLYELSRPDPKKGYQLNIANALWGQKGISWVPDFLAETRKYYGAAFQEVDFQADSDNAGKIINAWAARKTNNKIVDLLPFGSLPPLTRLVLANALYFKGTWVKKFEKMETWEQAFHRKSQDKVQVAMMHRTGPFSYAANNEYQTLEIPYKGEDQAMLVILPKKIDGLAALESKLTGATFTEMIKNLKYQRNVDVSFPKFKIESFFRLEKCLTALGMKNIFSDRADFSGITKEKIFLGSALQKTFVEVNEEGTEAAAVTVIELEKKEAGKGDTPPPPIIFRADHPFLFLIYERTQNMVLFMGRVMDPSQ